MKCEIIKDLLPAYCDNVCSEETKQIIEEHISECDECNKVLEIYKTELPERNKIGSQTAVRPFRRIKKNLFISRVAAVVLGIAVIGIIGATGYLGYGQIVKDADHPSFEKFIMESRNEKTISKLVEGDIDYIMNNTTIMPSYNTVFDNIEDIEEYRKKVLTDFYNECLKDKNPVVKVMFSDYSSVYAGGLFVSTRLYVRTDEGSIYFDVYNMEMGDVIVPFESKGEIFQKHHDILENVLYPYEFNGDLYKHTMQNQDEYFINHFTDGTEEYTSQFETRVADFMHNMTCENFLFSNYVFNKEKECYTTEANIFFIDEKGNRIVYKNTFEILGDNLIVSEEYKPVIINDGVSEEKEKELISLF